MATAKDLRCAIQQCAEDAMRDSNGRDVNHRAMIFAAYLSGWVGALGEADITRALRKLLDLPVLPTGDGA